MGLPYADDEFKGEMELMLVEFKELIRMVYSKQWNGVFGNN